MKLVNQEEKEWLERKGYFKKNLLNEDDIKSKGNLVQIVKVNPHTEIKAHYHKETIEVYYILRGNAILFFDDKKFNAKPGDIFLCEPNDVHGVVNDTEEEFALLVFKINMKGEDDFVWSEK